MSDISVCSYPLYRMLFISACRVLKQCQPIGSPMAYDMGHTSHSEQQQHPLQARFCEGENLKLT